MVGVAVGGWASERFGYKKTMLAALASMICFIFIPFFANNVQTLLAGEILQVRLPSLDPLELSQLMLTSPNPPNAGIDQGIPWGVFRALTPAYAVEV
ncbi:hypothetical protein JCM10021v2_005137 [Rhodotorula toruloides]